jgi:hypothetical protein
MATYTGRIIHATLTGGAVDTVTLDGDYLDVEILSRDGAAEIYFTVDTNLTPTVGGANCDVLPAVIGSVTLDASGYGTPTTVRLIATSPVAYSVKGLL